MASIDIRDCLLKDKIRFKKKLKSIEKINNPLEKQKALERLKEHLTHAQSLYQAKVSQSHEFNYPDLPIVQAREQILETIQNHQVVIIAGETGSGKSTQLSSFCLELGRGISGWIGHTQPRRLAARAIADRVCTQLNEPLGQTVGYKVRFNEVVKPQTKIKLMTDGILVNEFSQDKYLYAYDTLIIDEAHERSLNIDLILGLIKRLIDKRKDIKVIITSATINVDAFSKFFNDAPIIEVKGRTYPVEVEYLPDTSQDMFTRLLDALDIVLQKTQKDILVFLSGEGEIHAAKRLISQKFYKHLDICPLYAKLNLQQQRKIFETSRQRRVILATNVAETSLTVPNIGSVIDTGFARISRYSYKSKIQRLPIEPISQASIHQRTGRAGRVAKGHCLRLFSEEDYEKRAPYTQPEIQRTNLASVLLTMAYLRLGDIETFPWLDAPDLTYVRDGLKSLERLQALKGQGLTKTGLQMARLPVEPKLAKILIEAAQHHCLEEALIIVSGLCIQDPREYPKEHLQHATQVHLEYAHEQSSFLSYLNLWHHLMTLKTDLSSSQFRKHCQLNFINFMRFLEWQDIYRQLKKQCTSLKLRFNDQEATYEQIHKALLSGLFEGVGTWMEESQVYMGPRGIKFHARKNELKKKPRWVVAFSLVETQKVYANVVAKIEPLWVEAVAKHLCKIKTGELFWDDKSGYIKAYEQVTFFGLPLVDKRRARLKGGQEKLAREVFIQQALIDSPIQGVQWIQQNQKVVSQLEDYELRMRRPGSVLDEKALFHFYDKHLPANVYSLKALESWLKTQDVSKLKLKPQDISFVEHLNTIEENYPTHFQVDGLKLTLDYLFDPAAEADGVTLEVPLKWLALLQYYDFSWGLPGFLSDKIDWYLSKIPKSYRRQMPTLKECVKDLSEHMDTQQTFRVAFKEAVKSLYQIQIPTQEIESVHEPDYLKIRFNITDEGRSLLTTREFQEVLDEFSSHFKSQQKSLAKGQASTSWTFGDIPTQENVKLHGQMVNMYPALVDQNDAVALEYFQDLSIATKKHQRGVTRLFMLVDTKMVTYLKKNLYQKEWIKKNTPGLLDYPDLMDDVVYRGFYVTFAHEQDRILDEKSFEARFNEKKSQVTSVTQTYGKLIYTFLKSLSEIQYQFKKLKREKQDAFPETVQDIEDQLKALCEGRFVLNVPEEWLARYPVYLKALSIRMTKCLENPMQDSKKLKEMKGLLNTYQKVCFDREDESCEHYRWALEEYRISVFAQPMKPKMSLSLKKMKSWLKELI